MKTLKFNHHIYKKEAINDAVLAYFHLAKFTVKDDRSYIKVKIEKIDPTAEDMIADEFSNYVLGITKRCL